MEITHWIGIVGLSFDGAGDRGRLGGREEEGPKSIGDSFRKVRPALVSDSQAVLETIVDIIQLKCTKTSYICPSYIWPEKDGNCY